MKRDRTGVAYSPDDVDPSHGTSLFLRYKRRALRFLRWVRQVANGALHWKVTVARYRHDREARVKAKRYQSSRESAPERERARKRVLILEARIITPDQDSGSVRTEAILKLLGELGCKIEFVPDDLRNVQPYSNRLQQMGVQVWHGAHVASAQELISTRGRSYDYIILCRLAVAARHIEAARMWAPQAKVFFDTVDLHYLREERRAQLERTNKRKKIAAETRRRELDVVRKSDVTLVVSADERRELAKAVPEARVVVLSNIHEVQSEETPLFAARQGILFIGGFKHHPNVDGIEWFVREIWPLVRSSLPEATIEVVGSNMPDHLRSLEAPGVRMRGFVEDLEPILKAVRISIAPLRYGAGVKGKVNQAMAWGVPVVATPVAVEGMSLRGGVDVLVAREAPAFADAVVQLYRDEALWNRLAAGGRENVRRNFSPEVAMKSLQGLLDIDRDNLASANRRSPPVAEDSAMVCDSRIYEHQIVRPNVELSGVELGWQKGDFEGKTVLDIGSNSNVSVWAAKLGAEKIVSCDAQRQGTESCVAFPITVSNKSFAELDPVADAADIVLAYEASDSITLEPNTIAKLASLTNEVLYISIPWLKDETTPSLGTKGPTMGGVFQELMKYFAHIKIARLNFASEFTRKSVIIRCCGIRPEGGVLAAIGNAESLDIALSPATNAAILVKSERRVLVAKQMAVKSRLAKLEARLLNRLCDELNASKPKCLIPPLKFGDEYRIKYRGRHYMVLPFAGAIDGGGERIRKLPLEELVATFIETRRDLRKLSTKLIRDLQNARFFVPTKNGRELLAGEKFVALKSKELEVQLKVLLSLAETAKAFDFDAVVHGDLQVVNIIYDGDERLRCIDLDNMALATAYTDVLMALAWQGASEDQFAETCSRLTQEEARPVRMLDIAMAVGLLLRWRIAVEKFSEVRGVSQTVRKWEAGFRNLISWGEEGRRELKR